GEEAALVGRLGATEVRVGLGDIDFDRRHHGMRCVADGTENCALERLAQGRSDWQQRSGQQERCIPGKLTRPHKDKTSHPGIWIESYAQSILVSSDWHREIRELTRFARALAESH